MSNSPIDRCDVVPVEGKPFCFKLVDRETGETFDVGKAIVEGHFAKK
jgi:hypothetical protein